MAAPTEDEIQGQINDAVFIIDEAEQFLNANTPNVATRYDTYVDGLEGDFAPLGVRGADQFRAIASSLVSPEVVRAWIDPHLLDYAKLNGYPETDPFLILERLFVTFAEGSERVTTRAFTFDTTPTAGGSNVGTGLVNRLTVDRYAFPIENATPELKTFRCIADRYSGARIHQEIFEVRGANTPRDNVAGYVGPERSGVIAAISADTSLRIISNPSFNQYDGTAPSIDEITNWTVTTDIANFQIELTDVYRTSEHEGTAPGSVRFETNDTLTQKLSITRPQLQRGVPYYCQIAYKRESSCDGNLTLTVGSNSVVVALVAQSGWTILRLALDEDLFFEGFNETDIDVSIALDSRATGTLLVDDLVIGQMTRFDGTWWAIVGGATPYLVGDTIAYTDTATESILQRWLWRGYNRYLPSASGGSVTWAEPT